jgi:cytosine deaminase
MTRRILTNGFLEDGRAVDVAIAGELIEAVEPTGSIDPELGAERIDLEGRLLVPAFGEPHAHLDKAYLADTVHNPTGDLVGAVDAINDAWPELPFDEIVTRAISAVHKLVASGTTAIRTHVDTGPYAGTKSVEALAAVKEEVGHLCDLEVAPLSWPVTGPMGPSTRRLFDEALAAGADLVGGCPHLDDDVLAAIDFALDAAVANGMNVDLHFDEELDVSVQHLPELARRVSARGLEGRVAASHCVSHGLLPPKRQREIARMLADAGIAVITNPRTNLYLQSRGIEQAPPRGLAGVRALIDEGVTVAAGADNVQDPFYIIGRCDPMETATFLIAAAHLTVDEAWRLVGPGVRRVLGLPQAAVAAGSPAELVAIRAGSIREAIADQPPDRIVFHRGRLVARTTTETWVE